MDSQIFGLPVDREILFSNRKNLYKKRIEKRQRKLIVKMSFLKPFLKKGERILLITTGRLRLVIRSVRFFLLSFIVCRLGIAILDLRIFRRLHSMKSIARGKLPQLIFVNVKQVFCGKAHHCGVIRGVELDGHHVCVRPRLPRCALLNSCQ